MLAAKLAYNANSLALVDYGVQFTKARAFKDSDKFVGANGREFTTNFFGQIAADFTAHPTGNYTSPGDGPFVPINDSTRIKFAVGLECPSFAPPNLMRAIYANQMATLGNVISHDSEGSKQPRIKSWIAPTTDTGSPEKFFFTTVPLYKVPNDRGRANNFKAKVDVDDDQSHGHSAPPAPPLAVEPQLGNTYPCFVWPGSGYGGPRFNHVQSRAIQLNVRDPQGRLIQPQDTYLWLAPGAIVVVHATMHVYRFARMTIYQLTATSIQVIDKTDMAVAVPTVLALPSKTGNDLQELGGDNTPSGGFVDFASMLNTGGDLSVQAGTSKGKHAMDDDQTQATVEEEESTVMDEDVEMEQQDRKGKRPASFFKKSKKAM
ncbi:hypothetical protein F5878DRAFT_647441 [Lentinula raphanica]|uniref:Uncharacterized protein n=1 Tax=Lentinula raphanica TaxID=153919 RepID=A0AA38NW69_9AGAR|nr:hypothetical protein F5878DRAFT_647441 [Lentinula raphanica]